MHFSQANTKLKAPHIWCILSHMDFLEFVYLVPHLVLFVQSILYLVQSKIWLDIFAKLDCRCGFYGLHIWYNVSYLVFMISANMSRIHDLSKHVFFPPNPWSSCPLNENRSNRADTWEDFNRGNDISQTHSRGGGLFSSWGINKPQIQHNQRWRAK